MKILCILSEFPGHIDFGGMGFLRLAKVMKNLGHEVVWAAAPEHLSKIKESGFNKFLFTHTAALHMRPFFTPESISTYSKEFEKRIELIKRTHITIKQMNPDIILIDRVLQFGFLISEQLQIPTVSIGSPGGYWAKSESGVRNMATPITSYIEVGEKLKEKLNWNKGRLTSLWGYSSYLNICFLGKSFYQNKELKNAAYVNHFNQKPKDTERGSFGISFGNSGPPEAMMQPLQYLLQIREAFSSIEVFTGTQTHIYKTLKNQFGSTINLHGWVSFSDYFTTIKGLAFYGGVGTLWECLNYNVPMLVIPTRVGDQAWNGNAIERLGLGQCLVATNNRDEIVKKTQNILHINSYQANINEFKKPENYTDTMESVVIKITNLV